MICSSRSRYSRQLAISSGVGARLKIRPPSSIVARLLIVLVMYTSERARPIAASMRLSSSPALPTNGSPCRSSFSPGPSPTITSGEHGLPTPGTACVRVYPIGQRRQATISAHSAVNCVRRRSSSAASKTTIDCLTDGKKQGRCYGSIEKVARDQRCRQRPVPQRAVTLDPIQPAATLSPAEHARLPPGLLGATRLADVRGNALRQIHDPKPPVAEPVCEINLLMVEEEAFVESAHLLKYSATDEHRRSDHQVDVTLAPVIPLPQLIAVGLRLEPRQFAPTGAPQERLPPGVELAARLGGRSIFVQQFRTGHGDIWVRGEIVDRVAQQPCVRPRIGVEKE